MKRAKRTNNNNNKKQKESEQNILVRLIEYHRCVLYVYGVRTHFEWAKENDRDDEEKMPEVEPLNIHKTREEMRMVHI